RRQTRGPAAGRACLGQQWFDTEDTETQRTQRNFVISHQRLYRPRTVEFAVLRLRRVHQDRRAAFLSTPSESSPRKARTEAAHFVIKGMEALVIESYATARRYGVESHVLPTLQE